MGRKYNHNLSLCEKIAKTFDFAVLKSYPKPVWIICLCLTFIVLTIISLFVYIGFDIGNAKLDAAQNAGIRQSIKEKILNDPPPDILQSRLQKFRSNLNHMHTAVKMNHNKDGFFDSVHNPDYGKNDKNEKNIPNTNTAGHRQNVKTMLDRIRSNRRSPPSQSSNHSQMLAMNMTAVSNAMLHNQQIIQNRLKAHRDGTAAKANANVNASAQHSQENNNNNNNNDSEHDKNIIANRKQKPPIITDDANVNVNVNVNVNANVSSADPRQQQQQQQQRQRRSDARAQVRARAQAQNRNTNQSDTNTTIHIINTNPNTNHLHHNGSAAANANINDTHTLLKKHKKKRPSPAKAPTYDPFLVSKLKHTRLWLDPDSKTFFDLDLNNVSELISYWREFGVESIAQLDNGKYRSIQDFDLKPFVYIQDEYHNPKLNYMYDIAHHASNVDYPYEYPYMSQLSFSSTNDGRRSENQRKNRKVVAEKRRKPEYDIHEIYASKSMEYRTVISKAAMYAKHEALLRRDFRHIELIFPENTTKLFAFMYAFANKVKAHIKEEESDYGAHNHGGAFLRALQYLEAIPEDRHERKRFLKNRTEMRRINKKFHVEPQFIVSSESGSHSHSRARSQPQSRAMNRVNMTFLNRANRTKKRNNLANRDRNNTNHNRTTTMANNNNHTKRAQNGVNNNRVRPRRRRLNNYNIITEDDRADAFQEINPNSFPRDVGAIRRQMRAQSKIIRYHRRRLQSKELGILDDQDNINSMQHIHSKYKNIRVSQIQQTIYRPRIHDMNGMTSDITYFYKNKSSVKYMHNFNLNMDAGNIHKQLRIGNNDAYGGVSGANPSLTLSDSNEQRLNNIETYKNRRFWRLHDHCVRRKASTLYPNWRVLYKSQLLTCETILDVLLDPITKCLMDKHWDCPMLLDWGYFRFVFKTKISAKLLYGAAYVADHQLDPELQIPIVLKVMKTEFVDFSSDWIRHFREAIFLQQLRAWEIEFVRTFGAQFTSFGQQRAFYYVPEFGHCLYPTYITVVPFYSSNYQQFVDKNSANWTLAYAMKKSLEILNGLQVMHNIQGGPFLHTDIQPRQFMVDDNQHVLIGDFNRGKYQSYYFKDGNASVVIPCSFCMPWSHGHYRAPEEFYSDVMDDKLDVWSICQTVYNIFAFEKPLANIRGHYEAIKYLLRRLQIRPRMYYNIPAFLKDSLRHCLRQNILERPNINELMRQYRYFYTHLHRLSDGKHKGNWTLQKLRDSKAFQETNYPDVKALQKQFKFHRMRNTV